MSGTPVSGAPVAGRVNHHAVTVIGRQEPAPNYCRLEFAGHGLLERLVLQPAGYLLIQLPLTTPLAPTGWVGHGAEACPDVDPGRTETPGASITGLLGPPVTWAERAYTIVDPDPAADRFALEFVLHQPAGPASAWAAGAQIGDQLLVSDPPYHFALPTGVQTALVVADAAGLPGANSVVTHLLDSALPATLAVAVVDQVAAGVAHLLDSALPATPSDAPGAGDFPDPAPSPPRIKSGDGGGGIAVTVALIGPQPGLTDHSAVTRAGRLLNCPDPAAVDWAELASDLISPGQLDVDQEPAHPFLPRPAPAPRPVTGLPSLHSARGANYLWAAGERQWIKQLRQQARTWGLPSDHQHLQTYWIDRQN